MFNKEPIICDQKTDLKPCEICFVEKCPYAGNQYALDRIARRAACPFNILFSGFGIFKPKDEFKLNPLKASKRNVK